MTDFNDVSLYIYGFAASMIVLCSTIIVGNVDEDSFSIPVIMTISLFINMSLLSSITSKHGQTIENIQRASVLGSIFVNMFLVYVFMWDPSHVFCCYSSLVINMCVVVLSGVTYYHRYMFKTDFMDPRRYLAYVLFVTTLLFPLDVQHDSILFMQCMLFIIVFLGGLLVTLYTEECLIKSIYNEVHWLMMVVCAPIIMCNRFVSAVVAVTYTVLFIRRGVDQYFLNSANPKSTDATNTLSMAGAEPTIDLQDTMDGSMSVDSQNSNTYTRHYPHGRRINPGSLGVETDRMAQLFAQQNHILPQ